MKSKPISHLSFPLASAIAALLAVHSVSAANYYWDVNGTTTGFSTVIGAWNGTNAFWGPNSSGTGGTYIAAPTSSDDLFITPASTNTGSITISGTQSAGRLTFGNPVGAVTLTGGTLNLGATATINANNWNSVDIIASAITGASTSLTKIGNGGLTLQGVNTYTGETILNGYWQTGITTISGAAGTINTSSGITIYGTSLTLTNAATQGAVDRLNSSAASLITSNGGTLNYGNANTAANTYAETAGTLTLARGQLNTALTTDQTTSNGQTLTFGGLTQAGTSAVTFSAAVTGPQASGLKNMIVVTGAGTSAFIAPWATVGTTSALQTDYAAYNTNYVVPANITASAESTWMTSTDAYTSSSSTALSGDRTMAALRNTGGTATITLSDGAAGYKLATNGILNGVSTLLTIAPGTVAGSVTAPGVSGGNLYVTPGSGAITISAPINDNGGAVTLVKNGALALTLSNATSNYSGGTVINGGPLNFVTGALGTTGNITINSVANIGSNQAGTARLQWGASTTTDLSSRLTMVNSGYAMLDTNGNAVTFANAIGSSSSSGLGKTGSGTLNLNGINTYTGATDVYAGTLVLGAANATSSVRVGSSTANGGIAPAVLRLGASNALSSNVAVVVDGQSVNTLDLQGFNQTVGALSLGSNNGGSSGTVTGSGASTLTLTTGVAMDGHNNGAGTISVPFLDLNGATQNFSIVNSNNVSASLTVSSVIQNGGVTRTGSSLLGFLVLSGANTFSGPTTNGIGMLRLDNSLALQNSPLDTTASVTGDANNGIRTTVTTLTLGGLTGNKNLAALFTTNGTNPGQYGTVTALTLKPILGATPSYSGVIANGAAGMTLTKTGAGTQTLAGANTYSGSTIVNAGTLKLDYSTQNNSKLSDSTALVLGGGTLDLSGGTHTEIVASTTLTDGTTSNVTSSTVGSVLTMGVISQGAGAKVNFGASSIATTDNLNTNGILGAWATVNGVDLATNSTNAAAGPIIAYTGYADVDAQGPTSTIANGATSNVRIFADGTSGTIELGAATTTINTLLQSNSTIAASVNTAGKTLATSAVWIPSGKAALSIGVLANDGFLSAATAGGDLQLSNDSSSGLTINSVIADNTSASSLTKLGAGSLTLNGTNIYSGATNLFAGNLILGNASALGTGALNINGGNVDSSVVNLVNANSNPLNWNSDFTFVGTQNFNLGTGAVTMNANHQVTVAANTLTIGGDIGDSFGITKAGAGTLVLSGTNTYTGNTTVTGGTLNVTGSLTGNTTTSTLALGTTAAKTVVNVSNDMTLYAITGANTAGSAMAYNQTAGIVDISAAGVGSSSSYVSNIGYGYFNLTGGTFKSNGSFNIGTNNASSNAVAYVGGTGFLDWSGTGAQTLGYLTPASLTVGPGGSVSRGATSATTWLATNSGSAGILNIAGGSLDLGTAGNVFVNNTASGGTSVTFNLAGGTLTMAKALLTNGSTSGNLYANYAGGTLKASATLSNSPMNVLTSVSTIFGPIDNVGTTQDFTGGLTIDTNGSSMPYGNALRGATGNGVKQANISITGGSGYIGAPLVQFTGGTLAPNGSPAAGYAIISGGAVTEIVITSPGSYTVDPTVILTGGGGSGASVALSALTANAADSGLTKINSGTLTLSGANTYTGATTVSGGTLALVGGSQASPITLSSGASLGFTLGSPTTTTQDVNISLGTIKITGVPTLASYDLITSSVSITGTPVLAAAIPGYELKVESNVLKLKQAGYASWAAFNGASANLSDDHDNDGVSNGIEYFIGGPAGNTTGFTALPSVVKALDGTLSVTWPKGAGYAGVYGTDFEVETSATLSGVWAVETLGGGNITDSGASVKFTFPSGPPYSGKNFARLKVTGP